MKNSKEYGEKIAKLFKSLKKNYDAVEKPVYNDPIEAIIYALVSEYVTAKETCVLMNKLNEHFVDYNDLRVSRPEEIKEILDADSKEFGKSAVAINATLGAIFQKYDRVALDMFDEMGKRQIKKELEELDGLTHFGLNYCFVTAIKGHAVALTPAMVTFLRDNKLVDPETTLDDIEGFLDRQISATDSWDFYTMLRTHVEQQNKAPKTQKKKKTTKKTVKKTAKKKTAKKKTTI